jgi:hypothetical protein
LSSPPHYNSCVKHSGHGLGVSPQFAQFVSLLDSPALVRFLVAAADRKRVHTDDGIPTVRVQKTEQTLLIPNYFNNLLLLAHPLDGLQYGRFLVRRYQLQSGGDDPLILADAVSSPFLDVFGNFATLSHLEEANPMMVALALLEPR